VLIFAAVALILLVVSPGFRRTCGALVAAIVLFAVVIQVHDHFEKKAEAELAAQTPPEPDPCAGLESFERLDCFLAQPDQPKEKQ
jgi:hypothetical protein